jgi:hypothetical protein
MSSLLKIEEYLYRNRYFLAWCLGISLLVFGFEVFHATLSIDEEASSLHYGPMQVFINHDRWAMYVLSLLFQWGPSLPYFHILIAIFANLAAFQLSLHLWAPDAGRERYPAAVFALVYPMMAFVYEFNIVQYGYYIGLIFAVAAVVAYVHVRQAAAKYFPHRFVADPGTGRLSVAVFCRAGGVFCLPRRSVSDGKKQTFIPGVGIIFWGVPDRSCYPPRVDLRMAPALARYHRPLSGHRAVLCCFVPGHLEAGFCDPGNWGSVAGTTLVCGVSHRGRHRDQSRFAFLPHLASSVKQATGPHLYKSGGAGSFLVGGSDRTTLAGPDLYLVAALTGGHCPAGSTPGPGTPEIPVGRAHFGMPGILLGFQHPAVLYQLYRLATG